MEITTQKPPVSFWIIACLAIAWNLFEIYFSSFQLDYLEQNSTAAEFEKIQNLPFWYLIIFMIALFSEMLGAFLLFMRRKICVSFFFVAMVALIFIEFYWLFFFSIRKTSMMVSVIIPTVVVAVAVFLFFYSRFANRKGWFK
ncbi:hypothetical protein [Nonlabens spongiae]|nr:hypothetical protein [Nonlabens spongiae]